MAEMGCSDVAIRYFSWSSLAPSSCVTSERVESVRDRGMAPTNAPLERQGSSESKEDDGARTLYSASSNSSSWAVLLIMLLFMKNGGWILV